MVDFRVRHGFLISNSFGSDTCTSDHVQRKCVSSKGKGAMHVHVHSSGKFLAVGKPSSRTKLTHCRFRARVTLLSTRSLVGLYRPNVVSGAHCLVHSKRRVFRISRFCKRGRKLVVTRMRLSSRGRSFRGPSFVKQRMANSHHCCGSRLQGCPCGL